METIPTSGNRAPIVPDSRAAEKHGVPSKSPLALENRSTVGALFRSEESALLRFVFGIVRQRETAEEVVQEAFLKIHERWDTVENPSAWIYRAARNIALNRLRKANRERVGTVIESIAEKTLSPSDAIGKFEAVGLMRLLINELDHDDQMMLHLKFHEELSYEGISKRLGISVSNVGYRLHHLLKNLASALQSAGVEGSAG